MIRVLIVDSSAVLRRLVSAELAAVAGIEVVGTAMDSYAAREKILRLSPDVIVLNRAMRRMGGLSFLAKLMRYHPVPTVILSAPDPEHNAMAARAIAIGALSVIVQPMSPASIAEVTPELVRAIRAAARTRAQPSRSVGDTDRLRSVVQTSRGAVSVLAIGASTGGTAAIEAVLRGLPAKAPGAVIVQHMPEGFTASFAARLNRVCPQEVREARDGDPVAPGIALIAPGGFHLSLQSSGLRYVVRVRNGPTVHHQRPAVDVLFHSVARHAARDSLGVLLTGMGADGAAGLLAMREAGAHTIAQDEGTCVVYGMPREAVRLGAAVQVLPLDRIAAGILGAVERERPDETMAGHA